MTSQPDADTYRRELERLGVEVGVVTSPTDGDQGPVDTALYLIETLREEVDSLATERDELIEGKANSHKVYEQMRDSLAEHGFSPRGLVHAVAHAYECLTELRNEIAEPNIHDGENTASAATRLIDALRKEIERLKFAHGHTNDRWIDGIDDRAELRRQRDLATQLLESIVDSAQLFTKARIYETDDSSVVSTALIAQAERLAKPLMIVKAKTAEQAEEMIEALKHGGHVMVLPVDSEVQVLKPGDSVYVNGLGEVTAPEPGPLHTVKVPGAFVADPPTDKPRPYGSINDCTAENPCEYCDEGGPEHE